MPKTHKEIELEIAESFQSLSSGITNLLNVRNLLTFSVINLMIDLGITEIEYPLLDEEFIRSYSVYHVVDKDKDKLILRLIKIEDLKDEIL